MKCKIFVKKKKKIISSKIEVRSTRFCNQNKNKKTKKEENYFSSGFENATTIMPAWIGTPTRKSSHKLYGKSCRKMLARNDQVKTERTIACKSLFPHFLTKPSDKNALSGTAQTNACQKVYSYIIRM